MLLIPILLGVTVIVFGIMFLTPGDAAILMLGENAPQAELEALRESLGLNEPAYVQYGMWLARSCARLRALHPLRPARHGEIIARLPATVELALLATLLSVAVGVPLGVLSATRPNTVVDHTATVLAFGGLAMPVFWQGLIMILLFAVVLEWLPPSGKLGGWQYYVLPTITLGTSAIAAITRMTRATMLETLSQDYVRTARSKGVRPRSITYRHALRNAMIPDRHGHRPAVRRLAVGRRPHRDDLLLARHRPPRDRLHPRQGLPHRAGRRDDVRADLRRGEPVDRLLYAYLDPRLKTRYS
jgi:peptide/nickel transport system permease protein